MGERSARSYPERLTYEDLEEAVERLKAKPEPDLEKIYHEFIKYWRKKVMSITEMKAKKVMAGPGAFVRIAEALVEDPERSVYVTVQYYDGEEYSVADKSVYAFLDEDGAEPVEKLLEEYDSKDAAAESEYAEVFRVLCGMIEKLG